MSKIFLLMGMHLDNCAEYKILNFSNIHGISENYANYSKAAEILRYNV